MAEWKLSSDQKKTCEFMKIINDELYVGVKYYEQPKDGKAKPLHKFDGKKWEEIDLSTIPLGEGQFLAGATQAEFFNNKIFIGVRASPPQTLNDSGEYNPPLTYPAFYTLEDGKITKLVWYK